VIAPATAETQLGLLTVFRRSKSVREPNLVDMAQFTAEK